ncbi:NAD-binding protein [Desulforhopalus vacuolatus]|uniref:potassium channel family protein n=1 Tax=Desulforhopalus vacuolatus TaxID=40414 RepID=UPI00196640A3|nr:NAD-binding protein [Desulforhopalus vacuolatus]MBM9518443.1 NAD-binding protein [Desulforhopalus vacuolatus]
MKFLPAQLLYFFQNRKTQKNVAALVRFLLFVLLIILFYSMLFHYIMVLEGRNFSWVTGLYWTLTVMSTLGFGDITFFSDTGHIFTIVVLLSGIVLLLVILPFTFIQFFYAPWLEAQERSRVSRELPKETRDHVLLTEFGPITERLIDNLNHRHVKYAILERDWQRAAELNDLGYQVVLGELDDPETWNRLQVQQAALVVATGDDLTNTSAAFTVREVTQDVPMVLSATEENSLDILNFPVKVHVFLFHQILGRRLAERTVGLGRPINIVSQIDELVLGEISASQTTLAGRSLGVILDEERRVHRPEERVQVIGLWERGKFLAPQMDVVVSKRSILLLAGSLTQMDAFEAQHVSPSAGELNNAPVLILGGGRVGRAVAETLHQHSLRFSIVEKDPDTRELEKIVSDHVVSGDAADIEVLEKAGIMEARTVIVTTRDDAMNMYLCFYCRQLRADVQIISRTTLQRSVSKLHTAGADLVLSYASMGANSIMNILSTDEISMFTEGLNIFTLPVPRRLLGQTLAEGRIREVTGCSVIALQTGKGLVAGLGAETRLEGGESLVMIGSSEAEERFSDFFPQN